jgi:hypothetical protein
MTRRAGARGNGCKDSRRRNFLNYYFHHEDRKKHEEGGLVMNGESQINKGPKDSRTQEPKNRDERYFKKFLDFMEGIFL